MDRFIGRQKINVAITNAFQSILDESCCKPNKVWVAQGREFYNRPMKSWLHDNDLEMYSIHNGGKLVVQNIKEYDLQANDSSVKKFVHQLVR